MRAWFGPTFRYRRARTLRLSTVPMTINPTTTQNSALNPIMASLLPAGGRGRLNLGVPAARALPGHMVPRPRIHDSALVANDDYFRAFRDARAVCPAGRYGLSGARLRVDHLSGAVRGDGHRHAAQRARHVVVGGIERDLGRGQD